MIEKYNDIKDEVKKDEAKICDMLNKFNDNMKNNINNLYKEIQYKKSKLDSKLCCKVKQLY